MMRLPVFDVRNFAKLFNSYHFPSRCMHRSMKTKTTLFLYILVCHISEISIAISLHYSCAFLLELELWDYRIIAPNAGYILIRFHKNKTIDPVMRYTSTVETSSQNSMSRSYFRWKCQRMFTMGIEENKLFYGCFPLNMYSIFVKKLLQSWI